VTKLITDKHDKIIVVTTLKEKKKFLIFLIMFSSIYKFI